MNSVWTFEQGRHLPPTHRGVCLTLVAFWIQQMREAKEDINASGATQMAVKCQNEAQRLQKFYEKVEHDQDEAVTWSLRGLRLASSYEPCADTVALVRKMDEKRAGYSMGIYFSSGGGHALGLWRSGRSSGFGSSLSGHTYFFDPNVGCFKGDTGSVASWLGRFLADHYPDCNAMEIAKLVPAMQARAHWKAAGARRLF